MIWKKIKTQLTTILTALTLVVSIVAYFTMSDSLAWFSNSKTANASGMGINVQDTEKIISKIEYFNILNVTIKKNPAVDENTENTEINKYINEYTFSTQPIKEKFDENGNPMPFELAPYTPVGSQYQVLMRLTVNRDMGTKVKITANSLTDHFFNSTEIDSTSKSMSSIVRFLAVDDLKVADGATEFVVSGDKLKESKFATLNDANENGVIESSEITYSPSEEVYNTTTDGKDENNATNGDTYIYIIIEYYGVAADYIRDAINGSTEVGDIDPEKYVFSCDFSFTATKID